MSLALALLEQRVADAVAPVRHDANPFGYKRPRRLSVDHRIALAAIPVVFEAAAIIAEAHELRGDIAAAIRKLGKSD